MNVVAAVETRSPSQSKGRPIKPLKVAIADELEVTPEALKQKQQTDRKLSRSNGGA